MKYFFLLVYKMQSEQIKSKSNQYLMQLPQNSNSSCRSTGSGQVLFKHLDKKNIWTKPTKTRLNRVCDPRQNQTRLQDVGIRVTPSGQEDSLFWDHSQY